MKHLLLITLLASSTIILTGCSNTPTSYEDNLEELEELTQQAEEMTVELEKTQDQLEELLEQTEATFTIETDEQEPLEDTTETQDTDPLTTNTGANQGSCNSIDEMSICTQYYGTWDETEMKLNCVAPERFSSAPCPTDAQGGCSIIMEDNSRLVSWYYNHGGDPVNNDSIMMSQLLCSSTPGSSWIES